MAAIDAQKQQPQKSIETPEHGRREIHEGGKVAMKGHGIVDNNRGLTLAAQEELERLSLLKGDKDGKFGTLVHDSVRHFQAAHNQSKNLKEGDAAYLKPDGKVGSRTLKAMEETERFSEDVLKTTAPPSHRNRQQSQRGVQPAKGIRPVSEHNHTDTQGPAQGEDRSPAPPSPPLTTGPAAEKIPKVSDASQQYSTIETRVTELSDGIEKQIKGARAAEKASEQLLADNNRNREQRPTTDKVFGFLHNDAKEHNLRNEAYQAQAEAYKRKANSLDAAHNKLKEQLVDAKKLAQEGKLEEAQTLLQEAEQEGLKQSKVQVDLGTSKEKFEQASAAVEETVTWANRGLQVLQGTQMTANLNNEAMATMVGLKAATMVISGAQALRAGRLAKAGESIAPQSSRMVAGESAEGLPTPIQSAGTHEATHTPSGLAPRQRGYVAQESTRGATPQAQRASAPASRTSEVSGGRGFIDDGGHQMLITEHRLPDGSMSRTAIVTSEEGLAHLKQKWGSTIGDLSKVTIGKIPPSQG